MNYNKFLDSNRSKEETIIINIFIDAREELLGEYYKDPGVDKYEGFVWPNNKIIDIDYSEKNKEDLPSLIYNFLREIDNSINNIFSYAEGCRKNVIEIKALEKCIDLECAYIEPDKLEALGFSFENNNEYIIYDAQSIIRSTAMFELACNYFLKKSYNKAIELFYSASILGMKNAQKVLCELGPSLLPSGIIDKLKKSAFKSADGFSAQGEFSVDCPPTALTKYLSTTFRISWKIATFAAWQGKIHHSTTRYWSVTCFPMAFWTTSRSPR